MSNTLVSVPQENSRWAQSSRVSSHFPSSTTRFSTGPRRMYGSKSPDKGVAATAGGSVKLSHVPQVIGHACVTGTIIPRWLNTCPLLQKEASLWQSSDSDTPLHMLGPPCS